jgi:formamidopyrimidine-DNA glycosylase
MPELPDIQVFANNWNKKLAGKRVAAVNILVEKKLKESPEVVAQALRDRVVTEVYRSGKELRVRFEEDVVMGIHLMLTGDLHFFHGVNEQKFTIVAIHFADGTGIALTDRMKNASITINPADKEGIDALDKALNYQRLKKILSRKAKVKNVLTDQDLIRGIGNSYSDEILWETRIAPQSVASAIPDEKVKELARTIRKVLTKATTQIAEKYPDLVQGEVKDFLRIHSSKIATSPTGAPILKEKRGLSNMFYTEEQVLYK